MNNNFWKNKSLKKGVLKAYEKQNIKRLNSIIDEGHNISELMGVDNILIQSIKDKKEYCLKFFLIRVRHNEKTLKDAHIFLKENGFTDLEKTFILYTGQKGTKQKKLISLYLSLYKKNQFIYNNKSTI